MRVSVPMDKALLQLAKYDGTGYPYHTTAALKRRKLLDCALLPNRGNITPEGWAYLWKHHLVIQEAA